MHEGVLSGWKNRLCGWQMPAWGFPVLLLFVCIASYGLLIPFLGFYWDDFPISWIGETYGTAGLERYFSTNRPYWGWLYRLTIPLLGSQNPVVWQIFNLVWHWLSAVALWKLLRLVWSRQEHLASWAVLLYVTFPAFRQHPVALLYSHFWIVLTLFLTSQILTLTALRRYPGQTKSVGYWLLTFVALAASLYNLLAMEYFFFMELIRGAFIWWGIKDGLSSEKQRVLRTMWVWLPYLALWIGMVIWRAFFFSFQTQNYSMLFLDRLQADFGSAMIFLFQSILSSLWVAGPGAWVDVLRIDTVFASGKLTTVLFFFLIGLVGFLLLFTSGRWSPTDDSKRSKTVSFGMIWVGLCACLLAGWPFWLIEVLPALNFPLDRFTLPFALGISLLGAGLVGILPVSARRQSILISLLVTLAVGYQFRITNDYRREWEATQRFFWQLSWRVPALQPGTLVLSNQLPLWRHSDNSLTAPLNRMYAGDNTTQNLWFLLYYPEQRLGKSLPGLEPEMAVDVDYLAARFQGSTSQAVALVYQPPGCLRILDPELDLDNEFLPQVLQDAARLSHPSLILFTGEPDLPATLLGVEPEHRWCYFFEQADLARQQQDWVDAAAFGDQAFELGDYPNDPSERIPFIEAYAHVGRWQEALDQTRLAAEVSPTMELVLCRLWQRIEQQTVPVSEQTRALEAVRMELNCAR